MTNFILVPGMWLGGWAWDAVAEPLRAAGHDVTAVTLGGLAERRAEAPTATLDSHIADVVAAAGDRNDLILVGHSYGSLPVRGAAERLQGRISRVVYVEGGPVPSGTRQADFSESFAERDIAPPSFDPADDPNLFAGLAPHAAAIRERATPHPWRTAADPLVLASPEQPPTELVISTFKRPDAEAMIAANHPFFAGLDRRDYRLHDLPTGHWPMFSRPADLAALLHQL